MNEKIELSDEDWQVLDDAKSRRQWVNNLRRGTRMQWVAAMIIGLAALGPLARLTDGWLVPTITIYGGALVGLVLGAWIRTLSVSPDVLDVADKLIDSNPDLLNEKLRRAGHD